MAKRKVYSNPSFSRILSAPAKAVNSNKMADRFTIFSYQLNHKFTGDTRSENANKGGIEEQNEQGTEKYSFPGNISPEGYFYSPFYEVQLKELDDELQSIKTRRINFVPSAATMETAMTEFYKQELGITEKKECYIITITSPVSYNFIMGQPFCIYDVLDDATFRGYLSSATTVENGCQIKITTTDKIDKQGLKGDNNGHSRYIISLLDENAPLYADYIPASGKLIWRAPKKMSDLSSDSPLYNMPFTNGRNYIHRNLNVFVRRQDPHNDYKLFRPAKNNPLRRFQVEGDAKLDFDYIQQIIDSMVDAC